MKEILSAIVGCGAISHVHADAIARHGSKLVAVCDTDERRASALAAATGAAAYSQLEEMLEKEFPRVLHICTPHHLHVGMAEAALRRGIHVVMEKPPALNAQEFEHLRRVTAQSNASLCVCFQNRFNVTTEAAMRAVASGDYGKLLGARGVVTWDRRGEYYTASGWRGRRATEGGSVLINQAVHTLDLLNCFCGTPTAVASRCFNLSHPEIDTEDTVCAEIRYGAVSALLYASVSCVASPPAEITLFLERATVRVDAHSCAILPQDAPPVVVNRSEIPRGKACWGGSHGEVIGRFYRSLDGGGENPVPLDACVDTMRLMTAIYEKKEGELK